ncbi:MAG: tryptophan--tRNA ligase [Rickettsiales bacterium]|nr:tryptophan--tRNA ligase [Rickettsiales bacterium]
MSRVLSGIQPTGSVHLGNYLGFIKNYVDLLEKKRSEAFLFIADLHAITNFNNSSDLYEETIKITAILLASGLTPDICNVFVQSKVSEHTELSWILGCHTPLGWLNRMTQFKEKSIKYKEGNASLGLYSYPVLQASDILIYQTDYVPVGEDQAQHLELTRDIAIAFNRRVKVDFFKLPEAIVLKEVGRIMSLRDGKKKMSKSDESDYSRINLTDSSDDIGRKIRKAKTDAIEGISFDRENRPEISNLITIYASLSNMSVEKIVDQYANSNCSVFKKDLLELVVSEIEPIGKKIKDLLNNRDYIKEVLTKSYDVVKPIAQETLKEVKKLVGFV